MTDSLIAHRPERAPISADAHYAPPLRVLHWATAVTLVLALAAVLARDLVDDVALDRSLLDLHRSLGATVLILVVARVAIRLVVGGVEHAGLDRWSRQAAALVHGLLYGLTLLVPVLGWLLTNASGKAASLFGLVVLPPLTGRDRDLADLLEIWHPSAAWLLLGLAALHVAAALWHGFVRRDGVLQAMLPSVGSARPTRPTTAPR
ncbi:cytochrome b [Prosthecodimorpha staleyi]|uniref:Cytochrome b/b6 domain-containing protein n=1 Tax=Prosthecodimorpha staleyi TaxID=2840188 RepID=A0A947D0S8_9HYPH|nr:cytochrome b/b6 domain-containing protein [Prosthecodimorpha staleyi]MBT9288840.1 cytochrome b/b6 domain-containing protein [Prosthecodimorpha staleyi]